MGSRSESRSKRADKKRAEKKRADKLSPSQRRRRQQYGKSEDKTKLTDEQVAEFRIAFNMFDKDGGGSIEATELVDVLKSMGQNLTDKDIQEMIDEVDEDGNGEIDFEEFLTMMENKMQYKENDDEVADAFKEFDNGKGYISAKDLRDIMTTLGDRMTNDEVDEMLMSADVNKNGLIKISDFVATLCS